MGAFENAATAASVGAAIYIYIWTIWWQAASVALIYMKKCATHRIRAAVRRPCRAQTTDRSLPATNKYGDDDHDDDNKNNIPARWRDLSVRHHCVAREYVYINMYI